MISSAKTVLAYLRELPEERRRVLSRLRAVIRKCAPQARESMKYGLPHYDWEGPLFALASQVQYFSLYVAETEVVRAHRGRFPGLSIGKSCIRFRRPDQVSVPAVQGLLQDAVAARRAARAGGGPTSRKAGASVSSKSPRGASAKRERARPRRG